MPPRSLCLNAPLSSIGWKAPRSIATFATASRVFAADNTRTPYASDLLADLGNEASAKQKPFRLPQRTRATRSASSNFSGNNDATFRVINHVRESVARNARQERQPGQFSVETVEQLEKNKLSANLSKQISRRWKAGDVYAPHDLSAVEMAKWKRRGRPEYDVFDVLDLDPMTEYKNFSILSEYMTTMGRIKGRSETGLRPVNQRKIAKAIRRSIGMGIMPSVHRHPEILQMNRIRVEQNSPLRNGPM